MIKFYDLSLSLFLFPPPSNTPSLMNEVVHTSPTIGSNVEEVSLPTALVCVHLNMGELPGVAP